jgi:hypothetical protein
MPDGWSGESCAGIESWATNTYPLHNRERLEEAHELAVPRSSIGRPAITIPMSTGSDPQVIVQMIELYAKAAAEIGYEPGPQNFGYLWHIHVQDTEEKVFEVGEGCDRRRRDRACSDARQFHGASRLQLARGVPYGSSNSTSIH